MWSVLPASIVIVNVHGIGAPTRPLDPGEDTVWVSIDQLEMVLDAAVGRPDVRLTFDDGNASDVEIALPRLLERGLHAEFFIAAGLIGEPGRLNKDDIRELRRAGMAVGSHGWAHRDWRRLQPHQVDQELIDAPQLLGEITGAPVSRVSIPFGSYDRHVLRRLRQAKVSRAYTSDCGRTNNERWLQPRNSLRNDIDADWIGRVLLSTPSLALRGKRLAARTVKRTRG